MRIAVTGNLPRMPYSYPLDKPENSGNMIHARAPQRIFKKETVFHSSDTSWRSFGERSFSDFVNRHCDHLIITMANTIKVNSGITKPYGRFSSMLDLYDVPITIFGIGVRSPHEDISDTWLPQEAIDMMKHMSERCGTIGVRGEFTKKVFAHHADVTDVMVTGCPSFFSEPEAFRRLQKELCAPRVGSFTYSGTKYFRAAERMQFVQSVKGDGYYIEPTSAENHRAHIQALKGMEIAVPSFLTENHLFVEESADNTKNSAVVSRAELTDFFRNRYRLFRDPQEWLHFNAKIVAFGFGTRFHVNMATMLAGKPATWVTHDTRTRELVNFLRLPSVELEHAAQWTPAQFRKAAQYTEMFENLDYLFDNWAEYMAKSNLPYQRPDLKI